VNRRSAVVPFWQDRPPGEALEVASVADDLGFEELWIGEMATFDAFALATAIGRSTGLTLTIGPLAVGVRTPTSMALGTASVSALTGRPARLALGASSPVVVDRWHGRHWGATARNLAESAGIVRALLTGEKTDHDGRVASSHGYRLRLEPPGCHLTVAAFGPRALAVAAERADRLVMNMVTAESAARLVSRLRRRCRDAPLPEVAVWLPATVDPTPEDHAQLAHARVGYVGAPGYGEMLREAGYGGLVDLARSGAHPRTIAGSIPPELDDVVGLAGAVGHVEDRIAEYHAAGVDEVCLVPTTAASPGGARTLEALAPG
jgi:probable F420-dependent oxidoreductase